MKEYNELTLNPIVIKTIVTSTSIEDICKENGIEVLDVLTGFKYIGEKLKEYETTKEKDFIFGFEESYGYLRGSFVRDKDAIIAAMLICEMGLYYKSLNKSLYDAMIDIQEQYGAYKEDLVSLKLEGKEGQEKIKSAINAFRNNEVNLGYSFKIIKKYDYFLSEENNFTNNTTKKIYLPSSNVIKYRLAGDSWFAIRPLGTEPELKIYLGAKGKNCNVAEVELCRLKEVVMSALEKYIN